MTATNGAGAAGAASASEKPCACPCGAPITGRGPTGMCKPCATRAARKVQLAKPGAIEKLREQGRRTGARNIRLAHTPEGKAKAAAANAQRMAWCPTEYRDLNSTLRRKGFGLAERQDMIRAEAAKAARA